MENMKELVNYLERRIKIVGSTVGLTGCIRALHYAKLIQNSITSNDKEIYIDLARLEKETLEEELKMMEMVLETATKELRELEIRGDDINE